MTGTAPPRPSASPGLAAIVGWGLFCACSWTWVIGMYLPRIMGERYGWTGLLVFAIPNVVGCAAFGWVIRSAAASRAYAARHARLLAWFASATVGFHLLFFAWLGGSLAFEVTEASAVPAVVVGDDAVTRPAPGPAATPLPADAAPPDATAAGDGAVRDASGGRRPDGLAWLAFALPAGLLAAGLLLSRLRDDAWPLLATGLWCVSVGIGLVLLVRPGTTDAIAAIPAGIADADPWLLAPIVALGFLLCPYPDPTFHRARQACDSPLAFGVFGAAFACMLGVTLTLWFRDPAAVTVLAFCHLALQATFTTGAHLRELRERLPSDSLHFVLPVVPALLLAGGLATAPDAPPTGGGGLLSGEAAYLRYMALYGLVFPALVLLLAPPRGRPLRLRTPAPRTIVLALALLAIPCELAFIHGLEWLALLPIAALVAWAVRSRGDEPPAPIAAETEAAPRGSDLPAPGAASPPSDELRTDAPPVADGTDHDDPSSPPPTDRASG